MAIAVLCGAVFAACGKNPDNGISGRTPSDTASLTIYASLPGKGPEQSESDVLVRGMKLALKDADGTADGKDVKFVREDDTGADGNWNDGQVTDNARIAIRDPTTVAYIGEFDSGASALSIPILNEAGILQVSPTSGYAGLTRDEGIVQGEPEKYYPSGRRTFGRVTPGDHVQALAQVDYEKSRGCTSVEFLNDQEVYGTGVARATEDAIGKTKLKVVGEQGFDPDTKNYASLAKKVAKQPIDCVFAGVSNVDTAVRLWRALHRANAALKLFGPDRLVNKAFTGRIGAAAKVTFLTSPHLRLSDYPESARELVRRYEKEYGGTAPIDALYGYATMDAVLKAIDDAKQGSGSIQSRTIKGFFGLDQDSVVGKYTIGQDGDSSLSRYGTYTVAGGEPKFDGVVDTADD